MANNQLPADRLITSLDVRPEKGVEMTEALRDDLKNLHRLLGNPDNIDQVKLETTVEKIIRDVPGDFMRDLQESLPALKADFAKILTEYVQRLKGREPSNEDLEILMDGFILSLLEHQGVALATMRGLDLNAAVLAKYEPRITNRHLSVTTQRLVTILTWAASFYTSFGYFQEQVGELATKADLVTKWGMESVVFLGTFLPPFLSTFTSQTVRMLKEQAEKIAFKEKISIFKAPFRIVGNAFRGKRGLVLAPAATWLAMQFLVAVLDAYSNLTGFVTMQLREDVVAEAIDEGKSKIDTHVEDVRKQIASMKGDSVAGTGVAAGFAKKVKDDLAAEAGGTSKTATAGAGPMYDAKRLMYEDSTEARALLEGGNRAAPVTKPGSTKSKTKAAAPDDKGKLRRDLLRAIDTSKLASNATPLSGEVSGIMDAKFGKITKLIDEIKALEAAQDPSKNVVYTRADFKTMTQKIDEIMTIINKELPKDVNAHIALYNTLNEKLADIALRSRLYENFKTGKIDPWVFSGFEMKNDEICIPEAPYVDGSNLMKYMEKKWDAKEIAIRLLEYILISILISYGDLAFLPLTRRAFEKDDHEARRKRSEWMNNYREKVIYIVTRQLNGGMFGHHFHAAGMQVDPVTVAKVVDDRIAELTAQTLTGSHLTNAQQLKGFWKAGRDSRFVKWLTKLTPFSAPADYAGFTEVAQRHNAEVGAYQRILGSAEGMGKILQGVLPGLELVKNPRPGETRHNVLAINTGVTIERRDTAQADAITDIRRQIGSVQAATDESISAADWEQQWKILGEQKVVLDALKPQVTEDNRDLYTQVEVELDEAQREFERLLAHIVEHENLTATVYPSDPDEDLLARKRMLERLQQLLLSLDTTHNIDFETTVNSALRGITVALRDIDSAREEKARDARVRERREAMRSIDDIAEEKVTKVAQWALRDNPNMPEKSRAEAVAKLLGEPLAVLHLAPGQKIDVDTAKRLEDAYGIIVEHLRHVFQAHSEREDEIGDLNAQLFQGMKLLRAYFAPPKAP